MPKVISKDGTAIAFETIGKGLPIILVDGAMCSRAFGPMPTLASLLAEHFTVYTYDRRGRNESGDTQPYAVEREVEDIEALIDNAGGSAFVFGTSSGAALALEAAIKLDGKIKKFAMYEPPYNSDNVARQAWKEYRKQLAELVSADRRGDAAELFMASVGTPADQIAGMRLTPIWSAFEAVAPTLAYDAAVLGDRSGPTERAASVTVPALVMNGSAIPFMLDTAKALAKAIPHSQHRTLEGQTHEVAAEALAPALIEFFKA